MFKKIQPEAISG